MKKTVISAILLICGFSASADPNQPSYKAVIKVQPDTILNSITPLLFGSCVEDVNHEVYGGLYSQRIYGESFEEPANDGISAQWRADISGTATAEFEQSGEGAYNGTFCQRITKTGGKGRAGVKNGGLNSWGIPVFKGLAMKGQIMLRSDGMKGRVYVALESADGSVIYAKKALKKPGREWKKYEFSLKPKADDPDARFSIFLKKNGSVTADIAILYENESRQADGFLLRKDIVQGFIDQGCTALRFGGSMVNSPGYHLKDMIGPREDRPSYGQIWTRYASNGFGVEEFLQLCEAAGVKSAVAIPMSDSPQDIADMIQYLTGAEDTEWGAKRAAAGHPAPYKLDYLGMGNEECLFDAPGEFIIALNYDEYIERFLAIYDAVIKVNPDICFVNTAWWRSGEKATMEKVFKALDGKAAFWDYHPWADNMKIAAEVDSELSIMESWFKEWNPDTDMRCIIFEENGDTHHLRRALCHSALQNSVRRHGGFVEACLAANALQPYLQHDTHWDQGVIFFTPTEVWGQPPFYATRMAKDAWMPQRVGCEAGKPLDVVAAKSEDGKSLALYIVNLKDAPVSASIDLGGFPAGGKIVCQTLTGDDLELDNPVEDKERVSTSTREMSSRELQNFELPKYSYTTIVVSN